MSNSIVTTSTIKNSKGIKPLTMITAYDYAFAKIFDQAGIDMILVGDSLGNVILGYSSTLPVTMADMIHHTKAVTRACSRTLVVADMPFMSYQVNTEQALTNAGRLVKEAGAHAVKLEGGAEITATIEKLVQSGIPVVGHLGLTPQSVNQLGGFKVQVKTLSAAQKILQDAVDNTMSAFTYTNDETGLYTKQAAATTIDNSTTTITTTTNTNCSNNSGDGNCNTTNNTVVARNDDEDEDFDVICRVSDSSIDEGDTVTFSVDIDGGERPYDIEWDGDISGDGASERVRFNRSGTYEAEVTVEDDNGRRARDTCTVRVGDEDEDDDDDDDDDRNVNVVTRTNLGTPTGNLASLDSVFLSSVPYTGPKDILNALGVLAFIAIWSTAVAMYFKKRRQVRATAGRLEAFKAINKSTATIR